MRPMMRPISLSATRCTTSKHLLHLCAPVTGLARTSFILLSLDSSLHIIKEETARHMLCGDKSNHNYLLFTVDASMNSSTTINPVTVGSTII